MVLIHAQQLYNYALRQADCDNQCRAMTFDGTIIFLFFSPHSVCIGLANIYQTRHQFEEAEHYSRAAIEANPLCDYCIHNLGNTFVLQVRRNTVKDTDIY